MRKRHAIPVTADLPGAAGERTCALVRKAIRTALRLEGVTLPCEVDVLLTGDRGIRQINLEMRDVDEPTDVLSFPQFDFQPGEPPTEETAGELLDYATGLLPLGDMVVNLERAAAQAKEYGHSNRRELAYLAVHSALHLLGYDHLDEGRQKREMRAREDAVMEALGLPR